MTVQNIDPVRIYNSAQTRLLVWRDLLDMPLHHLLDMPCHHLLDIPLHHLGKAVPKKNFLSCWTILHRSNVYSRSQMNTKKYLYNTALTCKNYVYAVTPFSE